MNCCCGVFGVAAERQFTEHIATRDLESYRAKGPGPTTRLLRDGLLQAGSVDGALLDIGAGIGALTFELLDAGATRAIVVDASPAYIAAATREAARRHCLDAIQFIHDDFLGAAPRIPPVPFVTLDRVICCYPASVPLLEEALRHAELRFAFSYPRDVWYVRVWNAVLNGKRRLTGNCSERTSIPPRTWRRSSPKRGFVLSAVAAPGRGQSTCTRYSTPRPKWPVDLNHAISLAVSHLTEMKGPSVSDFVRGDMLIRDGRLRKACWRSLRPLGVRVRRFVPGCERPGIRRAEQRRSSHDFARPAESRRSGASIHPAGLRRQGLQPRKLSGQAGGRARMVREGLHRALNRRVPVTP